jgi:hypothetical protein
MTEKELGRALLDLDAAAAPAAPDPREMTRRILDRDRRRIRLLAGLATLFWTLTAAGVVCLCPFYVMIVAPRLRAYQAGRAQLANDWNDWALVGEWAAYWLLACIVALLLAPGGGVHGAFGAGVVAGDPAADQRQPAGHLGAAEAVAPRAAGPTPGRARDGLTAKG